MNHTYRKKPIVIEAFQMTEERGSDNADWPEWLHRAWQMDDSEVGHLGLMAQPPAPRLLTIGTLEGLLRVTWGDYIIQGVHGEIYPCKPDIFYATYDKVAPSEENAITHPKAERPPIPPMAEWPAPPEGLVWELDDDGYLLRLTSEPALYSADVGEVYNSSEGWRWVDLMRPDIDYETPQPTLALAAQALVDAHTPKVG